MLGFDTLAQAYGFSVSVGRSLGPNPGSKLKGPDEEQSGIELVIQFADANNVWGKKEKKHPPRISIYWDLLKSLKREKEKSDRFSKDRFNFFLSFFWVGKWKTLY